MEANALWTELTPTVLSFDESDDQDGLAFTLGIGSTVFIGMSSIDKTAVAARDTSTT
jgi:hypothetical protein